MRAFESSPSPSTSLEPERLNDFFPLDRQKEYVSMLLGRGGLTRRRAEYFVKLWAYLTLKHQFTENQRRVEPIEQLYPTEDLISCTHREAAELFYGQQERGSDRAAGMMIDQLAALGLLEKRFDGQTLCLRIRPIPELATTTKPDRPLVLKADRFNPRTDAIPVAGLIRQTYAMAADDSTLAPQRIARVLRLWGTQYPKGLRVLRRSDNLNPVGIAILYPTASDSEDIFSRPPGKSFYMTSNTETDPANLAQPGDPTCMAVYIRAWILDIPYLQPQHICTLLEDTQQTLTEMLEDYPNLCDLYSPVIHPLYEDLRLALGFQKTCEEHRPFYWVYLSLDRFLALDIQQTIATLPHSKPVSTPS